MTRLDETTLGRLGRPFPIATLPFVDTIDVEGCAVDADEPSPCLSTAAAVWYAIDTMRPGRLVIDLAGSTPLDPLVRLYSQVGRHGTPAFLGCASPVWNATLSLATDVSAGHTYLVQVGTSESTSGRVVLRAELHEASAALAAS